MPPGSAADPVVLDPMQTIVEVHWPGITHVSYAFRMSWTVGSGADSSCDIGGTYPPLDPPYWSQWKTAEAMDYSGSPTIKLRKNGKWIDPTDEAVTVTRPDLPSFSYAAWQYVFGSGSVSGYSVNGGTPRLFIPTGSTLDVKTPSGAPFYEAASISGDVFGDVFTGTGDCYEPSTEPFSGGAKYGPCTGTTIVGDTSNYQSYSSFSIARSGFSAVVDSKNFSAVGVALAGTTDFAGGKVPTDATITILLKRVQSS